MYEESDFLSNWKLTFNRDKSDQIYLFEYVISPHGGLKGDTKKPSVFQFRIVYLLNLNAPTITNMNSMF